MFEYAFIRISTVFIVVKKKAYLWKTANNRKQQSDIILAKLRVCFQLFVMNFNTENKISCNFPVSLLKYKEELKIVVDGNDNFTL